MTLVAWPSDLDQLLSREALDRLRAPAQHGAAARAWQLEAPVPERSWMILAYGDDRAYGGNKGYEDGLDHYSYDNRVANSRRLATGDLVVIADRDGRRGPPMIAGIARVRRIDAGPVTKEVGHCPECGKTRFKLRENRSPRYRCDNGHEFDEPTIELVPVEGFVARFGDTYRDARGA